jgi:hypothetical protein
LEAFACENIMSSILLRHASRMRGAAVLQNWVVSMPVASMNSSIVEHTTVALEVLVESRTSKAMAAMGNAATKWQRTTSALNQACSLAEILYLYTCKLEKPLRHP